VDQLLNLQRAAAAATPQPAKLFRVEASDAAATDRSTPQPSTAHGTPNGHGTPYGPSSVGGREVAGFAAEVAREAVSPARQRPVGRDAAADSALAASEAAPRSSSSARRAYRPRTPPPAGESGDDATNEEFEEGALHGVGLSSSGGASSSGARTPGGPRRPPLSGRAASRSAPAGSGRGGGEPSSLRTGTPGRPRQQRAPLSTRSSASGLLAEPELPPDHTFASPPSALPPVAQPSAGKSPYMMGRFEEEDLDN
jgi:hypothetical protein